MDALDDDSTVCYATGRSTLDLFPMTATVKNKIGLTVPPAVQHQAGFKPGDVVEFKVSGGVITILPKLPTADDEYTPEQRRSIDAQLDAAEKGPFHGPFNSAEEMITHMKSQLKKRAVLKKAKRSR
jgi:bifunctional DNA-binding transcriptional regulator/antitoxin component of YhaV-PrlF toxin-antitoxin module